MLNKVQPISAVTNVLQSLKLASLISSIISTAVLTKTSGLANQYKMINDFKKIEPVGAELQLPFETVLIHNSQIVTLLKFS